MDCRRSLASPFILFACMVLSSSSPRADVPSQSEPRRYPIQGHGVLELRVPVGWTDSVEPLKDPAPTLVTLRAPSGEELLISVLPNVRQDPDFGAAARIRSQVERDGRTLLPTAVESELVLHELEGTSHTGYFYSLTDRALVGKEPPPGEFRYLTQGKIGAGDLLLLFTVLTNEKDSPSRTRALQILGTAGQGTLEEANHKAGTERLSLQGKPWSLLVDLQGFELERKATLGDGSGSMLEASNPETHLMVSVFLERRPDLDSTKACGAYYWEEASKSPLPKSDVRHLTAGPMLTVHWLIPELMQKNVNAYLYRDGVCIDAHLSKAQFEAKDEELFAGVLGSIRFSDQ